MRTFVVPGIVLALIAAVLVGPLLGESPSKANPQAQRSATASAPATQRAAVYPTPELVAQCKKLAKDFAPKLDKSFVCVVEPPFVVFGNDSEAQVRRQVDGCITSPCKAMWAAYFEKKPDQPITVLLFKDDATYRDWAAKLFDDTDVSHFGYYKPDKRTMVMNISTGGGTLIHELTHALIVYDFPDVPRWFNEGLGSLHEGCQIGPDEIIGKPNWRLPALKEAIAKKTLRPLKETVTADDFYGTLRGLNYAQARYFMMYVQSEGLLKKLYRYYRDHHEGDGAAVKAIEHVFGRKIDAVDKDFVEYVKTMKF
jgi:hypothetical protein